MQDAFNDDDAPNPAVKKVEGAEGYACEVKQEVVATRTEQHERHLEERHDARRVAEELDHVDRRRVENDIFAKWI